MKIDSRLAVQKNALRQFYPAKELRTMVVLHMKDDFITLETVKNDKSEHRYKGKSYSDMYITKKEMEYFFEEDKLVAKSFDNIISLYKTQNYISVELYWLHSNGYGIVEGHKEHFLLDYMTFDRWYWETKEDTFKMLNSIEKRSTKIEMLDTKNLKKVIENKLIRKKFGRSIINLIDYRSTVVKVSSDWVDYSFYFMKYIGNQFSYNGGLILHKDYDNKENLAKAEYSIHT